MPDFMLYKAEEKKIGRDFETDGVLPSGLYGDEIGKKHSRYICAPGAKILVVDDNDVNIEIMKGLLERTEAEVTAVVSGKECIESLKRDFFHVVFLDHMMPNMDGIEVLKHLTEEKIIKKSEGKNSYIHCSTGKELFIIMLTANSEAGAKEEYLSHGFSDYLTKPVNVSYMEEKLMASLPKEMVETGEGMQKKSSVCTDPADKDNGEDKDNGAAVEKEAQGALFDMSGKFNISDQEKYFELIRIFIRNCEGQYGRMKSYVERDSMKDYAIEVHALKGNAMILGADRLADRCSIHEQRSKAGDSGFIKNDWDELAKLWQDTIDYIRKLFAIVLGGNAKGSSAGEKDRTAASMSLSDWTSDMQMIYNALDKFDTQAALEKLNALIGMGGDEMWNGRLSDIKYAIDSEYDEDKAMRKIEEMIGGN